MNQVALADRLLITKSDLVGNIAALETRLQRLNPGARIERVMHGEIDPAELFGAGLIDPEKKAIDIARWLNEQAFAEPPRAAAHEHHGHAHQDHAHHSHDTSITSSCSRSTSRWTGWPFRTGSQSSRRARRGPAAGQRHSQSPRERHRS